MFIDVAVGVTRGMTFTALRDFLDEILAAFDVGLFARLIAAAGGAGDEEAPTVCGNGDRATVFRGAEEDVVAFELGREFLEVVLQKESDQFFDTGPMGVSGDPVAAIFERGKRVSDRGGAFAEAEESVIIFDVADTDDVVGRKMQFLERDGKAAAFVDAGRKNHDGILVEDDLKLEIHFANDFEGGGFVGMPSSEDTFTDGKRVYPALAEGIDELRGRLFSENDAFLRSRAIEDAAIFGDDTIEDGDIREDTEEILQFPTRGEDELPSRGANFFQGLKRGSGDRTVAGDGAVVVAGEADVAHGD
jgi:hypothetical protein